MKRLVVWAYMTTVASCILVLFGCVALMLFAPAQTASARGKEEPYVPLVIPAPQDHAWCYVLVNEQRGIGNIHILDCVPKE